jgi:hypothetical protein
MSIPTKPSGAVPRLTSMRTLLRPALRAASTAASTCAGVVTRWLCTARITSPRWRPLRAASLLGLTLGDDDSAGTGRKVERPRDLRSERLKRKAEDLARRSGLAAFRSGLLLAGSKLASELFLGRPLTDSHIYGVSAAVADDDERYPGAHRRVGDQIGHRLVRVNFLVPTERMTSPCRIPALAAASPGWTVRTISPRFFGRPSDPAMSSSSG